MKTITVAHSSDADDIFMYAPISFGWVSHPNLRFASVDDDIQTLNENAKNNAYEVCAISFALYPKIAKEYALLRTAVSFADGYGPRLIKQKDKPLKKYFKVALSGEDTTNAMLFKVRYPNAKIIYMNFLEIQDAVIDGVVDAGVLIHEDILNIDERLEIADNIFSIWEELCAKYKAERLPLPLGAMVIKRSLPLTDAILVEKLLTKAVKVATDFKAFLSFMLRDKGLVRVNKEDLDTYLSMYANEDSIELNDKQKKAIELLYKIGFDYKMYNFSITHIEDFFVPREYEELRNS